MIHRFSFVWKIAENSELMYFGFFLNRKCLNIANMNFKILSDLSNYKVMVKLLLFDFEELALFENWDFDCAFEMEGFQRKIRFI